jgi:hypothetical protein
MPGDQTNNGLRSGTEIYQSALANASGWRHSLAEPTALSRGDALRARDLGHLYMQASTLFGVSTRTSEANGYAMADFPFPRQRDSGS